jgi:hypothetical protein
MMEIDPLAALHTELDFHLLLTQSNPPARKSLPPLWIAPVLTEKIRPRPSLTYNLNPEKMFGQIRHGSDG